MTTRQETALSVESERSGFAQAFEDNFHSALLNVHTGMPGIIQSYNSETRRCSVRPALALVTTHRMLERAIVHNVPVIFPAGGGYTMTFPLSAGDPVWIAYSQRGIGNFKDDHGLAIPPPEGFFSAHDAVVFPGFGPRTITPVGFGLVLQNDDGSTKIEINEDGIDIVTSGDVAIDGNDVTITGSVNVVGSLSINGDSVTP